MLFAFDMDGTLIRSFMREGHRDRYDDVEVLPWRVQALGELRERGHRVAIVTNQGGVAFGYQTVEQVEDKLMRVVDALGLPAATRFYACYHHPNATVAGWRDPAGCVRRKPSGGMLREAMRDAGAGNRETVYVGDMETDRQAADDAGVAFAWADAFFGDRDDLLWARGATSALGMIAEREGP